MAPRFLVAATLLLASILPVSAQGCRSVDADLADFESVGGSDHEFLTGQEKAKAIAIYNAEPPQTNEDFDIVFIGRLPNGLGVVAYGKNGEICIRAAMPPAAFAKFMESIRGRGI